MGSKSNKENTNKIYKSTYKMFGKSFHASLPLVTSELRYGDSSNGVDDDFGVISAIITCNLYFESTA